MMSEKETETYATANLEGEHLTGGPSLKTLLLLLAAVLIVAAAFAAWFFELGVSPQVIRARYLKAAHESLSRGNIDEAIIALRNATDADPRSAETFHEVGMAYMRAGNRQEAFKAFSQSIQINPNVIPSRFQLARLLASKQGLVQAEEQLLKIRELDPFAIEGILLAAELALAQDNLNRALAILRDAIAGSPNNIVFHMNTGAVQIAKGDYSAAEVSYRKALQLDPKSFRVRTALATIYLSQRNPEKAEKELLDAIKLEPESEEFFQVLGNFYALTRQFDHLEKLYRDLLAKKPDSISAKKVLVEIAFGSGALKQAKELTDSILKAYPADIDGLFFRSRLHIDAREYEKGSQLLTVVAGDLPARASAHYFLGIARLGMGRMDEARTDLIKSTELRPNWITPRLDLAALYLVMGEDRLALQEAQKVLEKRPDHREALYIAAGALYKKSDYNKALDLFERIQKRHPKDSAVYISLSGVYTAQLKFAEAQREYAEALRLSSNRIKIPGSSQVRDSYSTTVNNVIFNGSTDTFNHALLFSQGPTVNVSGTTRREFFRDINEPKSANDKILSVSDIQVFLDDIYNQSSELFARSASGNLLMLIPDWLFQNILRSNPTYTQLTPYPREDGYEEWFFCNSEKDGSGTPQACIPAATNGSPATTSKGPVPERRR